jgi:hypothetical protein
MRARLLAPDGTPRHESSGEMSAPSQENFLGISPAAVKLWLESMKSIDPSEDCVAFDAFPIEQTIKAKMRGADGDVLSMVLST